MVTLRNFFGKGRNNILKVVCLAFGITAGLLLIAKVHFESSYDTFFPDAEQIYMLNTKVERPDESKSYSQVSGAVAKYMAQEIPDVEAATRMTYLSDSDTRYVVDGENKLKLNLIVADTLWFDVFDIPVLVGNPREVLSKPLSAMVSKSAAEKFGGVEEAIGKSFHPEGYDDWTFTIEGVYEDFPENSSFDYEVISSIYAFPEWSLENWVGNDRYIAYAKLRKGADVEDVINSMREMQMRHVDMSQLADAGLDLSFTLVHLYALHKDDPKVRNQNNLMLLLGAILIVIAVLNYILIVLSTLMTRIKEVAVRRCYGSSPSGIVKIVLCESAVNLALALIFGGLIAWIFRPIIESMLGVSYGALLTPATAAIVVAVLLAVLVVTVAAPSWAFIKIPVAAAFRSVTLSQNVWKRALLFVEFAGTAYVAVMLLNITRQYDFMVNYDVGYEVDNLLICDTHLLDRTQRETLATSLKAIPDVKAVSYGCSLPINFQSGNNVKLPGDKRELFNVADMYYVTDDYFETMDIKVVDGSAFNPDESNANNIMVSRSFVEKMRSVVGWDSSPIGWSFLVTEHSRDDSDPFTVVGVYDDISIGTLQRSDARPSVLFYANNENGMIEPYILFVRLNNISSESIAAVNQTINSVMPSVSLMAESYRLLVNQFYERDKKLRDSIIACCIIALVISFSGLIGYVSDVVSRRRREIAIRKVNGATVGDILVMLSRGITATAIPAMVLGAAAAWWSTVKWFENFSSHIELSVVAVLLVLVAVYFLAMACVALRAYRAAVENPVKALYQN